MEWSWRTVMILIGLVAMVAILIDGFRRMRRARAEALRLDVSHDFKFPEEGYNPELPGEVRVVGGLSDVDVAEQPLQTDDIPSFNALDEVSPADVMQDVIDRETTQSEQPVITGLIDEEPQSEGIPLNNAADDIPAADIEEIIDETAVESNLADIEEPNSPLIPQAKPVNLDEQVPVLLDVEELGEETEVVSQSGQDDSQAELASEAVAETSEQSSLQDEMALETSEEDAAEATTSGNEFVAELEDPEQLNDPHLELEAEPEQVAETLADTAQIISQPVNFAGSDAEILAHRPPAEVVLVIHAIAQSETGFKGSDLIYLFNSCDLRYGEKNIFHRFEEADGAGSIQFSVSQSHEPGVFEPSNMAEQHFRGLSFFMSLPGAKRPLEAYEAMYEMAMVVSRNLKADVLDESLSALTPQTVEANREEIMTFERHQHLMMKKQGTR